MKKRIPRIREYVNLQRVKKTLTIGQQAEVWYSRAKKFTVKLHRVVLNRSTPRGKFVDVRVSERSRLVLFISESEEFRVIGSVAKPLNGFDR